MFITYIIHFISYTETCVFNITQHVYHYHNYVSFPSTVEQEQLRARIAEKKKKKISSNKPSSATAAATSPPSADVSSGSALAEGTSFRPTDVVTGKRQRVGITGSTATATKRAAAIMSKRPSEPLANSSNTKSVNGSIARAANAKNSCLVKAQDSTKHTARVKAAQTKVKTYAVNSFASTFCKLYRFGFQIICYLIKDFNNLILQINAFL